MASFAVNGKIYSGLGTSRSHPCQADTRFLSIQRVPTDPYFYATITLQNIAIGSRYWIARASDLSTVLASGLAGTTEITLESIPSYSNTMLLEIRVRKASEEPKYQPFLTYAYLVRAGTTIYVAQVVDNVA